MVTRLRHSMLHCNGLLLLHLLLLLLLVVCCLGLSHSGGLLRATLLLVLHLLLLRHLKMLGKIHEGLPHLASS